MIDTHSHIYLKHFDKDISEVLERASKSGVTDIYMPAIDFGSLNQMEKRHHPSITFHKMAGIHPCEVRTGVTLSGDELTEALTLRSSKQDIAAIGETGLDYYWSRDHIPTQMESLRRHCEVAKNLGKPVVLHNRESTPDLLDIVEEQQDGSLTGIWHCFNGSEEEGRRAIDLNLYLGIGGVVTFKNAGVDRVVQRLPLERMILETDAPYLAPVPRRGKRNEPSYLAYTAQRLAELFDLSVDELDRITTQTARRIFHGA